MELFLGGLAAFIIEIRLLGLLLAPRWTLRLLARPEQPTARAAGSTRRPARQGSCRDAVALGGTGHHHASSASPRLHHRG
jgi:hypothetical protein